MEVFLSLFSVRAGSHDLGRLSNIGVTPSEGVARCETVVVGASSGLGRCIAIGARPARRARGDAGRRRERLDAAAREAGPRVSRSSAMSPTTRPASGNRRGGVRTRRDRTRSSTRRPSAAVSPRRHGRRNVAAGFRRRTSPARHAITAAAIPTSQDCRHRRVPLVPSAPRARRPGRARAYIVSNGGLDKLVEAWRASIGHRLHAPRRRGLRPAAKATRARSSPRDWDGELAAELAPAGSSGAT